VQNLPATVIVLGHTAALLVGQTTGVLAGPFVAGVAHLVIARGPMVEQHVGQTMGASVGLFAAVTVHHLRHRVRHLLQAQLGSGVLQRAI
jgi:hypothetical protein